MWSNVKVSPTLCSGWCNGDMTRTDSPWMIRVFECQVLALWFFNSDICMLSEHSESLLMIPVATKTLAVELSRREHWINHVVHSSCAQLTRSDLFFPAAIRCFNCTDFWAWYTIILCHYLVGNMMTCLSRRNVYKTLHWDCIHSQKQLNKIQDGHLRTL